MNPKDYSNYGLAQELLRLKTHAPALLSEAATRLVTTAPPPDRDAMGRLIGEASGGEAVLMALAYIRWQAFGECRTSGWDGAPPTPADTVAKLETALASREQGATGHTDGGRNMFYEGSFDGESERQQKARLRWADAMRAAFERHTGNGWFDKDWHHETGLWAQAWRDAEKHFTTPAPSPLAETGEVVRQVKALVGASIWIDVSQDEYDQTTTEKRIVYRAAQPADGKGEKL